MCAMQIFCDLKGRQPPMRVQHAQFVHTADAKTARDALWEPALALCIDAKDFYTIETEIYRPERRIVLDALCRLV